MVSYKFRLYPNKEIERRLEEQLEICRWLYNRLLEEINKARKRWERDNAEGYADIDSEVEGRKSRVEESILKSIADGELSVME